MKPLTIHPGSALAGAGVLALVLLGTGVAAPQGVVQAHQITQRMFIENVQDMNSYPNPRDMVVIREGTPYVVPQGKILVVTALGGNAGAGGGVTELKVDDIQEVVAARQVNDSSGYAGNATSMKLLPQPGFVVQPGSTVLLEGGGAGTSRRAWGFLVDA